MGYLEAELVHGVDLVQVVHDEVKQGGPHGYGAVVFPGLVDLHLIHLGLQDLGGSRGTFIHSAGRLSEPTAVHSASHAAQ